MQIAMLVALGSVSMIWLSAHALSPEVEGSTIFMLGFLLVCVSSMFVLLHGAGCAVQRLWASGRLFSLAASVLSLPLLGLSLWLTATASMAIFREGALFAIPSVCYIATCYLLFRHCRDALFRRHSL
jgi:hypothetical protein